MTKEDELQFFLEHPDYLVTHGSYLYGTNTEDSDIDRRGFVVEPFEYLAGYANFDQSIQTKGLDRVVWSLKKFFKLLYKGDPQCLEMLWVPDNKIILCSSVGKKVRLNRDLFSSKEFVRRVLGYAQSEWRKVRGVTLSIPKRTPTEDTVVEDIRAVFHLPKEEMDEVVKILFSHHDRVEVTATRKLGEKRKKQIEKYGMCVSSACHSMRLLGEAKEFVTTGRLTFPRYNAERLLSIKQGLVSYEDLAAEHEDLNAEILSLIDNCTIFPKKPNYKKIEKLYNSIVAEQLGYNSK